VKLKCWISKINSFNSLTKYRQFTYKYISKRVRASKVAVENNKYYRGADKSLARSGRKQATATEDCFIYPIYNHNWRNINTIYIYNKTSIKRNILTIKQDILRSRSG